MRLKSLEIFGFKSFAQRTQIIFNEGITGIVGPNGSGKSNIADAVRWVLGEQSAKTLRGAKMEDVIFGGTQKRKAMTYSEVSLVFDNEDHFLPVDYTEVMVTRRVFKSGDSEYYLNKTACRLKDIVTLFRDTGIGKEGYSIIGQGRIDEILSQKSEDRRKVFEEAAGIANYKSRKDETEHRLSRTMDNLTRVEDIIEELERRVGPLEEQAETARAFLNLSEELKGLELNSFLVRHDRLIGRIAELEQNLANIDALLQEHETQTGALNERRNESEGLLARIEETLVILRQELTAASQAYHEQHNRLQRFEIEEQNRAETQNRLLDDIERDTVKLKALHDIAEQQSGGMALQDTLLGAMKSDVDERETALKAAAVKALEKETALERHKAAVIEAMNRVSDLNTARERQLAIQAQMERRLEEITLSAAELNMSAETIEQALRDACRQEQAVTEHFTALEAENTAIDEQVQQLNRSVSATTERLQDNSRERGALENRLVLLEEMLRDYEGYSQSVRSALLYAGEAGLKGVHDVVAKLIRVPEHLETAVDMVLGPMLQNIVTDQEETAKDLIAYLRRKGLGRATFLPLSAIRSKTLDAQERHVLKIKGCLGIASDRVECAPEYRPVVEYLLGRTVIAESLDAGIAIMRAGRHAFRLVTLEGDVMHSGGSMTGGSIKQRAPSFLSREREIKALKDALILKDAEVLELSQALDALEEERKRLKQLRQESMSHMHQEEIAVAREQERVQAAEARLENVRARMNETLLAGDQLRDSLQSIQQDVNHITAGQDSEMSDTHLMQEKAEAYRLEYQAARETQERLREELTQKLLEYSKAEHETAVLLKDRERLAEETRMLEDRIFRTEQAVETLQTEARQALAERVTGEELTSAAAVKMRSSEEMVEKTEAARRGRQEELSAIHRSIEELHLSGAADYDRRHQADIAKTRLEGELGALRDRIWNTYELTYAGAESFRCEGKFELSAGDKRAQELRVAIRGMGTVNVSAIQDYADTKARYDEMTAQRDDLTHARTDLEKLIRQLETQMEKQFISQFTLIQGYFQETFARLFGGGNAELKLQDPNDALNCGIEVIAQPPGKKLQLLSLLSGGEKALCAIAILFAMLKLKATPFCLLDEIEAALDEANLGYFSDYLAEYGQSTQFVVVTHRKPTMEHCDSLFGVAMEEQGVSRMVSVNLTDYSA